MNGAHLSSNINVESYLTKVLVMCMHYQINTIQQQTVKPTKTKASFKKEKNC